MKSGQMRELPAGRDAVLLDFSGHDQPSDGARTAQRILTDAVAAGTLAGVVNVIGSEATVLVQAEPGTGLDALAVRRSLRRGEVDKGRAQRQGDPIPVHHNGIDDPGRAPARAVPEQRGPARQRTAPDGADLMVLASGPLTTIQDLGRPGYGDQGVPLSGAADRRALKLANRLVGNAENAACLEVCGGGLHLLARRQLLISVTGAPVDARVDGVDRGHHNATTLPVGAELTLPPPAAGLRTYVAVRGGIDVTPVLGSRSCDLSSGLGPGPLQAGDALTIGDLTGPWPSATEAPWDALDPHRPVPLYVAAGPRLGHLEDPATLFTGIWTVTPESDRAGIYLRGDHRLRRRADVGGRAPEPVALGSIRMTPGGAPVIALSDHPTMSDHPVVGVLVADSIDVAAQLVPGRQVRFVSD